MRRLLGVVVGLLALVGVGASATHYLYEPYNPGFLRFPTIVALHVVLGGIYLALAPLQFVGRIRSRHLGYHRWAGRVLLSMFTDFEDFTKFKPDPLHESEVHTMLDQLVAWGRALQTVRLQPTSVEGAAR